MNSRITSSRTLLAIPLILAAPHLARAQHTPEHAFVQNVEEIELAAIPGLPACAPGAVQRGDPATGPSVLLGTMEAGCTIPWHWHSPNEHIMMIEGEVVLEMRDGESLVLRRGSFALMPSGHVHQARCTQACTMFVYSDAAFDLRYVDATGREISADEALAAARESIPESR